MLDSRTDLPVPSAAGPVLPDFLQQDTAALGVTFPHPRFLSAFKPKPTTPFSSLRNHGRHLQGSSFESDKISKTAHGHSFQPLVYNFHHFTGTDGETVKPRDHRFSLPHFDSMVTNPLGGKRYLDQRLLAQFAFPQAPLHFMNQDSVESLHCPRSCQSGQGTDFKINLTYDSESVGVVRSLPDSFISGQRLSSIASDLPERTAQLLGRHEQRQPWRHTENMVVREQVYHQRHERSWTVDGEAKALHDMKENSIQSNRVFLPVSFGEFSVHNVKTVDSLQVKSSAFPATSSPFPTAAGNKRSLTSSTLSSKPQQLVSGLKEEHCTRTSSKDTYLRSPRKAMKRWERLCRPRSYRDSSISNKGRSVMAARSSLTSAAHKSQKMKLTHRAGEKDDHSKGGQQEEEVRKTFKCIQCRYVTDRKNNLKRHVVTMHHKTTRVLECCGTVFHNKASLRDHVALYHRGGYRCQVCGRNFCRKALLRRHLTVHSGQKDFACELCGYATSHKSNLERHQRVHTRKSAFFGHDLPSSHRKGDPNTDLAILTRRRTTEYESDDVRNMKTSFGQAYLNNLHEDRALSPESTVNVETPEMSPFSRHEDQQHPAYDDTRLEQQNATIQNRDEEYIPNSTLNTEMVPEGKDLQCEMFSRNTDSLTHGSNVKVHERPQLAHENQRLCRDHTSSQNDYSHSSVETIGCCSYPEANQSAASPSRGASDNDEEDRVRKTKVLPFWDPSRSQLVSRKVCFPNRLKETYPSSEDMLLETECTSASEILVSHETDLQGHSECDEGNTDMIIDNVEENKTSMSSKTLSAQLAQCRCPKHNVCTNQKHVSDGKGDQNKRNEPQTRVRMYSLPYRCSGCRACFTHQGELSGHVCQVQGGCILDFPLMSSVMKGYIQVSLRQ